MTRRRWLIRLRIHKDEARGSSETVTWGTSVAASQGRLDLGGMENIDKRGVAARLRSLMTGPLDQVARWLNVSEAAVRAAIQQFAPRPTTGVIVAAAIHYGVDPAWIVAADYDPDALRAAAEGDVDATTAAVLKLFRAAELDVVRDDSRSTALLPTDETVVEFSRPSGDAGQADRHANAPRRGDNPESPAEPRDAR
jgi:uncharacterized protein (DUF1684 family)